MPKTEKTYILFQFNFFPIPTTGKAKRAHEHAQVYTDRKRILDPLNHNAFSFHKENFEVILNHWWIVIKQNNQQVQRPISYTLNPMMKQNQQKAEQ